MIKLRLTAILSLICSVVYGQFSTVPELPVANQEMTLTVDVSETDLAGYTDDVWIWAWSEGSTDVDAPTNVNPATDDQSSALMTRSDSDGDVYTITFTPTEFFGLSADEMDVMGFLLKGQDWSNGQTPDYEIDLLSGQFEVRFISPSTSSILLDAGEQITITAQSSSEADMTLYVDGGELSSVSAATEITFEYTAADEGQHEVTVRAVSGDDESSDSFSYSVRTATVEEARPEGIGSGITYLEGDESVTLCLLAPMKSSVYVVGDFNDWSVQADYQMKKDGEYFWLEINGLTAGQSYAYQYLVDETIWIADPYADLILDQDDSWIPSATYPNIPVMPEGAYHDQWYENRAAVFETGQTDFAWTDGEFQKPEKEKLLIYELLVRDFLGEENMNYQALIDTLGYIKDLGVNTIELMPIMEFNGNDSWGYNPTFMFAVDKAYGSKDDLKSFINACHEMGLAVILDMVMNQNDIPSPYAQMYFDFDAFKATPDNPWFNPDAKHPFNVFQDINHESAYTQDWLDDINQYWLEEYHFDGYRFDLSKGFTQSDAGGSVSLWGNKDEGRIAILKRMADEIWSHTPDAYVILEHFADNDEEQVLSDYGMMLWGNSHGDFKEANLGYASGKSVGWAYAGNRGWEDNHLISYMESHDEERQMYDMLNFGSNSGSYDVTELETAIDRLKMSAAYFFAIPGPKMLWQWGEYAYDISIEENGRTGRKPTHWEYLENAHRTNLLKTYREVIGLRNKYDVFTEGEFSWQPDGEVKTIHLNNEDTSVVVLTNYALTEKSVDPEFSHTGIWYDFFSGTEVDITDLSAQLLLDPGEFRIYTDHKLHTPEADLVLSSALPDEKSHYTVYPNPTSGMLRVEGLDYQQWYLMDLGGRRIGGGTRSDHSLIDLSGVKSGIYTLLLQSENQSWNQKIIVK